MDAEESGDPLELEKLKNSYCNSFPDENKNGEKLFPELTNRSPSSRRRPLLPIQCTTPKQDSYFLSSAEYTSTPCMAKPKPKQMSYADVLKPSSKRTVNERYCLSPVEGPAKKHQICDTPQSADIEFLPKEQTPGHLERAHKLPQRKLAFISKYQLSEEEPVPVKKRKEKETDSHRLEQRQKQIDFGKNTIGYERYVVLVPRELRSKDQPVTPDKNQKCSKRSWDGQVRKWRRLLHAWDPALDENTAVITTEETELAGM